MLKVEEVFSIVDKKAPIAYSKECITRGEYDNSGIIVNTGREVKKILFSLDLSVKSAEVAKKEGCDLIVTHHPAIYYPVKTLSILDDTAPVLKAAEYSLSVISMHLNLDTAKEGIDHYLAKGLGAKNYKILDALFEGGYGREYALDKTLEEFVNSAKAELKTERVQFYGNPKGKAGTVASFCGGGSSLAIKYLHEGKVSADTIVTSDVPHHAIKELADMGKNLVIIAHYPAEEYGFSKFYESIKGEFEGKAETLYFCDENLK